MHLGIDLGTSNSAVAGHFGGAPRVFKTADEVGADVLSSAIFVDKRGNKFFGFRAYKQLAISPKNVADGFKRLMGTSWTKEFAASGLVMTAEECSADILKQLVLQAGTESGGEEITGTVITVPAAFNQTQRQATARAAAAAGIEKVAFLQEPIAAALAVMAQTKNRDSQFLVYDLGGGTFDLALVKSVRGSVSIIAHEGDNILGGRDFDRIIVTNIICPWLLENFALPENFQKSCPELIRRVTYAAEMAKIELSKKDKAVISAGEIDLRITDDNGKDIYVDIPISREDYEPLIADDVARTVALSQKILKDNGFEPKDIDKIVLIGGPCKTPFIRETVLRELGISLNMNIDPMTAVALGAAIDCETRDWSNERGTRKDTRASERVSGPLEIQYNYPAQVTDKRARIDIRLANAAAVKGYEISVDSAAGWTSGRRALEDKAAIEVPVDDDGKNIFRIWVYDGEGKPASEAGREIAIVRSVSSASTPLAQTIALKTIKGEKTDARNVLVPIIEKGQHIPAEGVADFFRAASDVDDEFKVEVWEMPNLANPVPDAPNWFVGCCVICAEDLPEGAAIRRGDEVHIRWNVNESHLISMVVEIPSIGMISSERDFFSDEDAQASYEGENGRRLAEDAIRAALRGIEKAERVANPDHLADIDRARDDAEKLREELRLSTGNAEENRSIVEKSRRIRGVISAFRHDPAYRVRELTQDVERLADNFEMVCRDEAEEAEAEEFDRVVEDCRVELERGESGITDARALRKKMIVVYNRIALRQPQFVQSWFEGMAKRRHLAVDKARFDEDVAVGREKLKAEDFDSLSKICFQIQRNRAHSDDDDNFPEIGDADIMRK